MIYDRPINIMLVDDHKMILKGLRGLLETEMAFRVVAEATGEENALLEVNKLHKANELRKANGKEEKTLHLVVTDLEMPRGTISGFQLITKLLTDFPALRILVYTMYNEETYILQAIKAGAWGYVTKDDETAEVSVIEAIRRIVKGHKVFPLVLKPEECLTLRQKQVLWLLGDGKTNEEIATILDIVEHTVTDYRSHISQKLRGVVPVENAGNPALLIICAVKYRMRCHYPDS